MKILIKNATIPDFPRKRFVKKNLVIEGDYIKEILPGKRAVNVSHLKKTIITLNLFFVPYCLGGNLNADKDKKLGSKQLFGYCILEFGYFSLTHH